MKAFSIYFLLFLFAFEMKAQESSNFRKNHLEVVIQVPIGNTALDDLYNLFQEYGFTGQRLNLLGEGSSKSYPFIDDGPPAFGIKYWRDISRRSRIGLGFNKYDFGSVRGRSREDDILNSRFIEFSMRCIYVVPGYSYNLWKPFYAKASFVLMWTQMEDQAYKNVRQNFPSKFSSGFSFGLNLRLWDQKLFTFTVGSDYIFVSKSRFGPLESNKGYSNEGEKIVIPEREYNYSHLKFYFGLAFNF